MTAPTREQVEELAQMAEVPWRWRGSMITALQRFARLVLSASAASRPVPTTDSTGVDVLTEEECIQTAAQCWCDPEMEKIEMDSRLAMAFTKRLAAAARIGVERERERAARVAEGGRFLHDKSPEAEFGKACAAAIRRGEGG